MSDQRGHLKVFIGMAPGVGKTFRMLQEGRSEADSGRDVAIGYLEPHGRAETVAQAEGLELIPRRQVLYRGTPLEEMDLPGVLARKPELCLIDELAHTDAPGLEHEKRYEDVRDVLDAGIDVFSTVNVQHLESLNDQITRLTGAHVRETIPDEVLAAADEVVLIDLTPETLIARLRAGKVYRPERIEAALNNFFKIENLSALRETALRQVAEDVEVKRLVRQPGAELGSTPVRRDEEGLGQPPEPKPQAIAERLLALVALGPHAERILRRAWRSSQRLDAELDVLVVRPPGRPPSPEDRKRLEELRRLSAMLGARLRVEEGEDVAAVAISFARSLGATYVLMGTPSPRRGLTRLASLGDRSLLKSLLEGLPGVDIRLVADPALRGAPESQEIQDSSKGLGTAVGEGVQAGAGGRFEPPERPEVA
jgi:two-component system sensor histidine kinase KdpD